MKTRLSGLQCLTSEKQILSVLREYKMYSLSNSFREVHFFQFPEKPISWWEILYCFQASRFVLSF